MAQHILNIAFDFDDDKIRQIAENAIEKNIEGIIQDIICDEIAPYHYDYLTKRRDRDWTVLMDKVDSQIKKVLDEHKDDIIDLAATKLSESYKRTKAWKEKTEIILGEVIE